MRHFYLAAEGQLGPLLIIEDAIPNEAIKEEGYWPAFGTDHQTGQPITTCPCIDRLAPKAWAVVAVGTCASYGGIHAMQGNPIGCMGLPDYLGWTWTSKAGIPIVCVPGCPTQPDNRTEILLYLLNQIAGRAPMILLDDALRDSMVRRCTKAAIAAATTSRRSLPMPTALFKVLSNWDAGGLWCNATLANGAGYRVWAVAPTLAAFTSAAPCRASRIDSYHS